MSETWRPSGVTSYQHLEIDPHRKAQICRELKRFKLTPKDHDAFFAALSGAISLYHSAKSLTEETKPATVRKNLHAALEAAAEFNKRLRTLDDNSSMILRTRLELDVSRLRTLLEKDVIPSFTDAVQIADQYPKRGRLPDYARLALAIDVAKALETHVGVAPTSTKEGPFEATLAIVLEVVTGKESQSTHDLARQALACRHAAEATAAPSPP